jgi:replicative DNA helicase
MASKGKTPKAEQVGEVAVEQRVSHSCEALIVAALTDINCVVDADIQPSEMPMPWHQSVWGAITRLAVAGASCDIVILAETLERDNVEIPAKDESWMSFLGSLYRNVGGTPSNVASYAETIRDWKKRADCVSIARTLLNNALAGEDGSDEAVQQLMKIKHRERWADGAIAESMTEVLEELDYRQNNPGTPGLSFGIAGLDRGTGGMTKQHLVVLAARPSMGKTAAALNMCMANRHVPGGFISTEQPRREMLNRLLSIVSGVDARKMRFGGLVDDDWMKLTEASAQLNHVPLYMSDDPKPHINDVTRQARKWKNRFDIQYLFVDYLQRVRGDGKDRHVEVGSVARGLKNLARELDIPVIALCQIGRGVEARQDKRPTMADLRESGDIEQEADLIITLYRDEVYHENTNKGEAEYATPKNRHGALGKVLCHFNGRCFRFEEQAALDLDQLDGGVAGRNGAAERKVGAGLGADRRTPPDR